MRQYPLAVTVGLLLFPLTWPIDSMAHPPSQSMVRNGISLTPKDQQKANDSTRRKAQEDALRKAKQEAARRKAQEEVRRKAQQDAAKRRAQEEARRKAQQEAARRKALEDARRKAQQDAAKRKAQEDARRKALDDARRKAQQDAAKRKAQEDARRKAQQDAAKRRAQEETRRKAQQEAARRKALEDARRKAQQDAAKRRVQEEARRKVQQDAAKRKSQEEALRREPIQKTSGQHPAKLNPQPIPFKPRDQHHTEQSSSFSNKSSKVIQRPSRGAEWNPTGVKPSSKYRANLGPKPPTDTNHGPWFLNNAPIKDNTASPPDSDDTATVCWWEPAPSPVIDIDIHLGSGSNCWTPVDHHHWWFGGGWHWHHHHAATCHSFGWGFLCWSRPGCHTMGWRPWWDRPNCVEWWTPRWNWCSPSVHYVTLPPPPPPSSQQCWDALSYGHLGLARRDFLKRLAADPLDADSRLGLALCEGLRGNTSGMQAELLRVLEDDPWVCMSWRPRSLRDQLKGLLRNAGRDARRVDVPERWVVVGALAAVAQEDGVALAALQRAFTQPRAIPGTELLQRLVQDRQLGF